MGFAVGAVRLRGWWQLLPLFVMLSAARGQDTAPESVRFNPVPRSTVERRLAAYSGNDSKRENVLKQMFLEAGCPAEQIFELPVPKRKQPNLQCILPGSSPEIVVIGAHFDHADEGSGVIDNWSGASMLPSLIQGLVGNPHKKTFWLVAFAGEESGLMGSETFARDLSPDTVAHIAAMVNLDSLGAGPTLVWLSQSDPTLVKVLGAVATMQHLPVAGMTVNGVGVSDEESFIARHVCTVTLHSITPENYRILHSSRDNMSAVDRSAYYASYELILGFAAVLGSKEIPKHACTIQALDANGQVREEKARR